jgi:acyl-CoA reductase-like NAD-dependent aldehyde dehydrogenase
MAANDPDVRSGVARQGGLARVAKADPEEIARARRSGAAATNSAVALARRIVKAWPTLSRTQRAEVRDILAPLMPRQDRQ